MKQLRPSKASFLFALVLAFWAPEPCLAGDDLASAEEKAVKAAVALVAPSVVQIETSGGTDVIGTGPGQIRKGVGPTTGLIVAADGYIISSAFNFANKPSAIFVAIPGRKDRLVAKVVATDHTRMLTLLKVDATGLIVPQAAPKKEMQVGQWTLALGRTWAGIDTPPSVSIGIISALGRIWGRAIQTDAKVSPINYGGPLIDLRGRVLGILVPLSPRSKDETAGVEWYDSGIGFAIPLEAINRVLSRLREGHDLNEGRIGITMQSADIYGAAPVVASIAPDSAAQRAGIKPGDTVTAINGVPIVRQAQLLHLLGDKYEGDVVSVTIKRGKETLNFPNLKLTAAASSFTHPFLGVLPLRDDPEPGEEIRYVFPQVPAEAAGLKAGDRILKIGPGVPQAQDRGPREPNRGAPLQPFSGRDQLTALLNHLPPGLGVRLEVRRKDQKKTETINVTLGAFSEVVPEKLPEIASRKQALAPRKAAPVPAGPPRRVVVPQRPDPERPQAPPAPPARAGKAENQGARNDQKKPDKKSVPTGLLKRTTSSREHQYWLYVPDDYDANVGYALVVWLHPSGKDRDRQTEDVISAWEDYCSAQHIILLCPRADTDTGWLGSDIDFIQEILREVLGQYTVDRERIVAHGMGNGGQMAFYLGFYARDLIRAVATVSAALANQPKDNVANQRLSFFIVAGGQDPLLAGIQESKTKLAEHKFPVVYREIPARGHQYLDGATLQELIRWIDSLDRQ
jgi:S1-C subfamily serine protease/acetyl esterase/lipase